MEDQTIICGNCDGQGVRYPERSRTRCSHCDGKGVFTVPWQQMVETEGVGYAIELLKGMDEENVLKRKTITHLTAVIAQVRDELESILLRLQVDADCVRVMINKLTEVLGDE